MGLSCHSPRQTMDTDLRQRVRPGMIVNRGSENRKNDHPACRNGAGLCGPHRQDSPSEMPPAMTLITDVSFPVLELKITSAKRTNIRRYQSPTLLHDLGTVKRNLYLP